MYLWKARPISYFITHSTCPRNSDRHGTTLCVEYLNRGKTIVLNFQQKEHMRRQYFANCWHTPIPSRQIYIYIYISRVLKRSTYNGSLSSISLYIAKTFVLISVSVDIESASKYRSINWRWRSIFSWTSRNCDRTLAYTLGVKRRSFGAIRDSRRCCKQHKSSLKFLWFLWQMLRK